MFRSDMAATSTWIQLRPTRSQPPPNLDHLAPTSAHFGSNIAQRITPSWSRLRATMAELEVHMASMWDTWPPNWKPVFIVISNVFLGMEDDTCWAMFPMLCLRWAHLEGARVEVAPCSAQPGPPCTSHSFNLGSLWAQLQSNMTNWRQPGVELGARRSSPRPGQFCVLYATSWEFSCLKMLKGISKRLFAVMEARARTCCPHWTCFAPNFGDRCPHTGPSCSTRPNLGPNMPKLRRVEPQLGSSWAQGGWLLLGLTFGQGRPNLTPKFLVGPSRPALFFFI